MIPVPFAVQSYKSRSLPFSQQRVVNAYAVPGEGKAPALVPRTAGVKPWGEVGNGICRGLHKMSGQAFAVMGPELYRVLPDGSGVFLGSIPGNTHASMASDGDNLVVASEGRAFVFDGTTVEEVTDEHFFGAIQVAYIAGYFIYIDGTGRFQLSRVKEPKSIDATDFASAESAPDKVLAVITDQTDAVFFGEDTTEIWGLRTGSSFPLIRHANGVKALGCDAPNSPAKGDNSFFWLADDLSVRVLRGGIPERISTEALEHEWSGYPVTSDAEGHFIAYGGRYIYSLAFPTQGTAFEYDLSTGLWNERESYGYSRYRLCSYLHCYGKHLVADATSNKIGVLDKDTYTEWGESLIWKATSTPLVDGVEYVFHEALVMDFEQGVGTVSVNPKAMLRWSDDGRTWGDTYTRSLGGMGEYGHQSIWYQLGRARNRVYEASVSDPVPVNFAGAHLVAS